MVGAAKREWTFSFGFLAASGKKQATSFVQVARKDLLWQLETSLRSTSTASLRSKILNFRGFDSSIILILRGGILTSIGDFLESLSQIILEGIILVGRWGAALLHGSSRDVRRHRPPQQSQQRRPPTPRVRARPWYISAERDTRLSNWSVCLSTCPPVCLSLCLSVSLSLCLSVSRSLCLSVSRSHCFSVSLSLHLLVYMSICPSVHLSISLYL